MRICFVDNVLLGRTDAGYAVDLQPHLGLISLIAVLREQGHVATLYDPKIDLVRGALRLNGDLPLRAARRIAEHEPDIVGFTSLGCNFICTARIAREIRGLLPNAPIMLGGPHATILDREIIERFPQFDVIARHEAEATIGALVDALGGRGELAHVAGVTYRRGATACRTGDSGPLLDLDALPFPAYDAYPIDEVGITGLRVDAGRGCPFSCTFCSTASFFGRRYRLKSAEHLLDQLGRLESTYGIRRFSLSHDLFTVNKAKVREFCRVVRAKGYRWSCSARMDCVDDELLHEMRDAGCWAIYYGVETGSPRMQRLVSKNLDLDLYHPRLAKTVELGMSATASFITGYPGESREDQDATLELIGETVRRYPTTVTVQLHLLTPEPGTALYEAHRGALRYDGHPTDFTFPVFGDDDEAQIASDPHVFSCHRYFEVDLPRTDTTAVTEAFLALYALEHPLLRALVPDGISFAAFVREFAERLRASGFRAADALRSIVEERFGADHPCSDAVRFLAAHASLRPESRRRPSTIERERRLALSRCVVPFEAGCDGGEVFRRLSRGEPLESPSAGRGWWLLLATPDLRGRDTVTIDRTMFEIATQLERTTTFDALLDRFGEHELTSRLAALCLVGAVADASSNEDDASTILVSPERDKVATGG